MPILVRQIMYMPITTHAVLLLQHYELLHVIAFPFH